MRSKKELKHIAAVFNRMKQEERSEEFLDGYSLGVSDMLSFEEAEIVRAELDRLAKKYER